MNGVNSLLSSFGHVRTLLASPEAEKVVVVAQKLFGVIQGGFLAAMGGKELVIDGWFAKPSGRGSWRKVSLHIIDFSKTHGALFGLAGGCGILAGLHRLHYLDVGKALFPLEVVSNGAFIYANFVELKHCITMMKEAEVCGSRSLRNSAFLGVMRSISYIVGTVAASKGPSFALALYCICMGVVFGSGKIIHDALFLTKIK